MNIITENWLLKLMALVFAVVLWFFVTAEQNLEKGFAVPLELQNIPEGMVVSGEVPSLVDVRVSGPRTVLLNLEPGDLDITIDLKNVKPGITSFKRLDERFRLPRSLKVTRVSPSVIDVKIERVSRKTVPVRAVFSGVLPPGLAIGKILIEPPRVELEGSGSELKVINEVLTEPIEVSEVQQDFSGLVTLDFVGKHTALVEAEAVEVTVTIVPAKNAGAKQERNKKTQ